MNIDKKIAEKIFNDLGADGYLDIVTKSNTNWCIWASDDIKIPYSFKAEITDNTYEKYIYIYKTNAGYIHIDYDDLVFYNKFIDEFTAYYSKSNLTTTTTHVSHPILTKLKELWI